MVLECLDPILLSFHEHERIYYTNKLFSQIRVIDLAEVAICIYGRNNLMLIMGFYQRHLSFYSVPMP